MLSRLRAAFSLGMAATGLAKNNSSSTLMTPDFDSCQYYSIAVKRVWILHEENVVGSMSRLDGGRDVEELAIAVCPRLPPVGPCQEQPSLSLVKDLLCRLLSAESSDGVADSTRFGMMLSFHRIKNHTKLKHL
jgi:hypothetical protein